MGIIGRMSTDTSTRRELTFQTLDEILADAQAITSKPHKAIGGWTAPQIIEHLVITMKIANHGMDLKVPLVMKLFGQVLKLTGQFDKSFKPGIKPPAHVAKAFAPRPDITLDDALQGLRDETAYAKQQGMTHPSPLFGTLSHDQWEKLHCRHAELHLGFIVLE